MRASMLNSMTGKTFERKGEQLIDMTLQDRCILENVC